MEPSVVDAWLILAAGLIDLTTRLATIVKQIGLTPEQAARLRAERDRLDELWKDMLPEEKPSGDR